MNSPEQTPESRPARDRRVGTFTFGAVLVICGALMLVSMFFPSLDLTLALQLSPLILVCLGVEVLLASRSGGKIRYDWVGTFGLLLLLYLWDGLVGFLPSTAVGSLLGFFVVLILVCFLINALSNNWKVTAGVLVAGAAVLIAFYLRDSSVFANLLPDVLGKFSLLSAFDSFSTDHVFDVPGILLYLSISALLVFLTVQVIQKRRWN